MNIERLTSPGRCAESWGRSENWVETCNAGSRRSASLPRDSGNVSAYHRIGVSAFVEHHQLRPGPDPPTRSQPPSRGLETGSARGALILIYALERNYTVEGVSKRNLSFRPSFCLRRSFTRLLSRSTSENSASSSGCTKSGKLRITSFD